MIKSARLVKIYCTFPKEELDLVAATLQDLGAVHLFDIKEDNKLLKPIKISYKDKLYRITEKLKSLKKNIEAKAGTNFIERVIGPRYTIIKIASLTEKEVIKNAENFFKNIEKKYAEITEKNSKEIKRFYYNKLLVIIENLEDIKERINALGKFGATKYVVLFGGFADKNDYSNVINALDSVTKGKCAFEIKDASTEDKPPTLLANIGIIRPFEILTENYGLPSYNGIDPTFILAMTFTLFFGIMFPDVGYGIVLVTLSSFVYLVTRKTTKFVRNLNIILIYCGLSSILFGFLFGEFLGGFIKIEPFLEPTRDILTILLISLLIGVVHISLALLSSIFTEKSKLYSLSMFAALWSMLFFAYTKDKVFLILFSIAFFGLFRLKKLYIIEELFVLFTHIVSYLRIGILSIAHITISRLLIQAVQSLPKNISGIISGIVLIGIGISISFIIGIFVVFLQSLRLHWLEFFGGFEFEGEKFEPFGRKREYLY